VSRRYAQLCALLSQCRVVFTLLTNAFSLDIITAFDEFIYRHLVGRLLQSLYSLNFFLLKCELKTLLEISYAWTSVFNPLITTPKTQSNGPSYINTVIGILAVDGWAVAFGTARRELGGAAAHPGPFSLYQM